MYSNYQEYGVENYYKLHGDDYKNPHYNNLAYIFPKILQQFPKPNKDNSILDLACGSGEITRILIQNGYDSKQITGMDPYTNKNYELNTQCQCLQNSFHDILSGKLQDLKFDYTICSYAIHLVPENGMFAFLTELAYITNQFLIITHMRKIEIKHYMWQIEKETYFQLEKIKVIYLKRIE